MSATADENDVGEWESVQCHLGIHDACDGFLGCACECHARPVVDPQEAKPK